MAAADETAMTKTLPLFFYIFVSKVSCGIVFPSILFVSTIRPLLANSNLVAPSPYQELEVEHASANARYTSR